jgi:hypothetical protein
MRNAAARTCRESKGKTMLKITTLILLLASGTALADQSVSGYTRQDGTYVQPYHRSAPNGSQYDNYSSQGNVNPYTGQRGTERNDNSPPAYDRYGRQRGSQ